MPVRYEPSGVIPVNAAAGYGASGGGGGGGGNVAAMAQQEMQMRAQAASQQAQLMQQDRQFGDRMLANRTEQDMQQTYSPREAMQAQAQAGLQLRLQQEEFSHADNMRLQRLKQADAQIEQQVSAGILTQNEALVARGQLRGVMDPLEQKKQQTEVAMLQKRNQMMDVEFKAQAERQAAVTKLESMKFEDRWAEWADPAIKQSVAERLAQTPGFMTLPPQQREAMIIAQVRREGGMMMGFQKKPGEFDIIPARGAGGGAGKGEPGDAAAVAKDQQREVRENQKQAWQLARDEAKEARESAPASAWSEEKLNKRAAEHYDFLASGGGKKKDDQEPLAGPTAIANLDQQAERITLADGLTGTEKTEATMAISRFKELLKQHQDPANRPHEVTQELEKLRQKVKAAIAKAKPPAMSPDDVQQKAGEIIRGFIGNLSPDRSINAGEGVPLG